MELQPECFAWLRSHDQGAEKFIPVPEGQSLDFDEGSATRRWLWPYLGRDYHLMGFYQLVKGK